jgi:hypothetical protein
VATDIEAIKTSPAYAEVAGNRALRHGQPGAMNTRNLRRNCGGGLRSQLNLKV